MHAEKIGKDASAQAHYYEELHFGPMCIAAGAQLHNSCLLLSLGL
jgi:hypothetical protein